TATSEYCFTNPFINLCNLWLRLLFGRRSGFIKLAFLVVFVLQLLKRFAFASSLLLATRTRVRASEREVHFRARGRELHAFLQLLDRSVDLSELEQHASQHVARGIQLWRELHSLFRQW